MSNSNISHQDLALVNPRLLPTQMRKLVDVIGLPDTVKLLQARGGTLFRFPLNAEGALLADIVGLDSARKLAAIYGGQTWELPKTDKVLIKLRNMALRKARETKSVGEVAQLFDLSRRHVINLTRDEDDHTPDLFVDG